jgi:hypothetical protein
MLIRTPVGSRPRSSTFEGRDLPWPHRGGVSHEEDGPVPDAFGVVDLDRGDDLTQLGHRQRMSLADRGDPEDPTQAATDPPDEEVGGRVGQSLLAVAVRDAGAVAVQRG